MYIKIVDLFAGIGGIRLGVENAAKKLKIKTETVFACDINEKARSVYRENFIKPDIQGDIRSIDNYKKTIGKHDLLLAGFPCPPFSLAGVVKRKFLNKKHGFADRKGNLFPDIIKVLEQTKPKAFLLENVSHLKSHNKGKTFARILKALEDVKYKTIKTEILNAKDFGLPQSRKRVFIIGFRKKTLFNFPSSINSKTSVNDILQKKVDDKYFITKKLWKSHKERKERNKRRGVGFGYSLVKNTDSYTRTLSARYYKDGSEILLKVKGSKVPRKLTPRECARLQGFPNTFKLHDSDVE
ncbi:MAG: DNA-cytosine methyltransferase, partial [Alphaproteobacteria bacterium MarineAlpha5_Bin12]